MLLALCVLLIYLSPNIFFQTNARFLIHDNLNSNVVWYKNLAESGKMFGANFDIIPNSLGGLPRGCYPSELNVMHLLYSIFNPLLAYNINIVLIHLLAFFSMLLFARRYVFKYENKIATIFIALAFSLLPFWPSGGASIAGQPLLLYALLNIYNKQKGIFNWLVVFIIPFYSVLVLSNLFLIFIVFIVFLFFCFKHRKINLNFVFALSLFTIASVISEYRLYLMQFVEHFQSHRQVVDGTGTLNLKGVIGVSLMHFFRGHYHFIAMQSPVIVGLSILAVILTKVKEQRRNLFFLLAFLYSISIVFVLTSWSPVASLLEKSNLFGLLTLRFYSLFPIVWFVVFAYCIKILIEKKSRVWNYCVGIALAFFCLGAFISFNTGDYQNSKYAENSFYNTFINDKSKGFGTFDEYYKNSLFKQVKMQIPEGNYYVACLGLSPEIAQYNNYNTIDGYFYYYPKAYNEYMKEVCKGEIDKMKDVNIKSHCVILSKDFQDGKLVIDNLDLNFNKLKEKNTRYIFSTRKIVHPALINEKVISTTRDKLFIYSIN